MFFKLQRPIHTNNLNELSLSNVITTYALHLINNEVLNIIILWAIGIIYI